MYGINGALGLSQGLQLWYFSHGQEQPDKVLGLLSGQVPTRPAVRPTQQSIRLVTDSYE